MILHPVYCLHSFCLLICDWYDYWFFHLGISLFVYGSLCVGNRLRIPPCFMLLQNLQASVHYSLCLNECWVFQLILDKILHSQHWHSSPPPLFLYRWRDMSHASSIFWQKASLSISCSPSVAAWTFMKLTFWNSVFILKTHILSSTALKSSTSFSSSFLPWMPPQILWFLLLYHYRKVYVTSYPLCP